MVYRRRAYGSARVKRGRSGRFTLRSRVLGRRYPIQAGRTRRPVRRKIRRPTVSRRRILNVSTRKKQDNMQPMNINVSGPIGTPTPGRRTMNAADGVYMCLWNATWRPKLTQLGGAPPIIDDTASRTATNCYMRGLKERIEIQTSGSAAWEWRRICFTFFSNHFYLFNDDPLNNGTSVRYNIETNTGVNRALTFFNLGQANDDALSTQLLAYVFKGAQTVDWNNPFTAKTHNDRVSIKYDKTITIRSGNDAGVIKKFSRWHAMNANLTYDEDEVGGTVNDGIISAAVNSSMGDYYVLDMFKPTLAAQSSEESMSFEPEATLYWHER